MTSVVLYSISPIHVLAQLTALRHAHPGGAEATLILHWPFADAVMMGELTTAVKAMTANASDIRRVKSVSQAQVDAALAEKDEARRAHSFVKAIGVTEADEIVFPHDVSGFVYQLLATAFPHARRVTTGENLGHVFQRDVYFSYLQPEPPKPKLKHRIKAFFRAQKLPAPLPVRDYPPEIARLLLPVDQSGRYLDGVELDVPPRALAQETLRECVSAAKDLARYAEGEAARIGNRPAYLLCTQNYAEAGTIDFDREIDMWRSVVTTHCAPGSILFIKAHPAETLPRTQRLALALGDRYDLHLLDSAYSRYPVELWSALVTRAKVISASMPALSLKYLYGVDTIQPFSDAFIAEWFPQQFQRYYQNGLSLFTGPLERFEDWDGASPLWRGEAERA